MAKNLEYIRLHNTIIAEIYIRIRFSLNVVRFAQFILSTEKVGKKPLLVFYVFVKPNCFKAQYALCIE